MISYFEVVVDLYDSYVNEVVSFKFSINFPSSNLKNKVNRILHNHELYIYCSSHNFLMPIT